MCTEEERHLHGQHSTSRAALYNKISPGQVWWQIPLILALETVDRAFYEGQQEL